eukprot:1576076-Pyramimonas_sp.AAC.1
MESDGFQLLQIPTFPPSQSRGSSHDPWTSAAAAAAARHAPAAPATAVAGTATPIDGLPPAPQGVVGGPEWASYVSQ